MTAWIALIALFISVLSLIVNVVSQRDKLFSAIDDFKTWKSQRDQNDKAITTISKMTGIEIKKRKGGLKLGPIAFYTPLFLISVICSILLENMYYPVNFQQTIPLKIMQAVSLYVIISTLTILLFLLLSRRLQWRYFNALFSITFYFSWVWGILTGLLTLTGLQIMWSGIVVGGFLTLTSWLTGDRVGIRGSAI